MAIRALDKKAIRALIDMDLQQVNTFKLILIDRINPSLIGSLVGGASTLFGNAVTTVYLQTVTFPSAATIEYGVGHGIRYPKDLKPPENVTFTFLEDNKATVWRYLQTWRKSVIAVRPVGPGRFGLAALGQSEPADYMFADSIQSGKKMGILLLGSGTGRIGKFPRIVFQGLTWETMDEIQIGHTVSGHLTYTVTLSVDEIGTPLAL